MITHEKKWENRSWSVWFLWFYLSSLLVLLFIEKKIFSLIFLFIWTFFFIHHENKKRKLRKKSFCASGENVDKWISSERRIEQFFIFFFRRSSWASWHDMSWKMSKKKRWEKIARKFIINWNFSSWSVREVINHLISMSNVSLLSFLILNISIFHLWNSRLHFSHHEAVDSN